jgi:hypothetical protein
MRYGESMNSAQYRVIVVVDRGFGEKLETIPAGVPVWIVDSSVNRAAAEKMWAAAPQVSHLEGITIFTSPEGASPERSLIGQIDTIDLHHGIYSADPPYSVLDVIGVAITEGIKSALEQNGFTEIHPLEAGFRASHSFGPELP